MAVYAVAFLLLYPKVPAIVDEHSYLTQALLFRTGHITYENSSIPAPQLSVTMTVPKLRVQNTEYRTFRRNAGREALKTQLSAETLGVEPTGRIASKYPPGTSLFLLPFTLPGWRWAFLSGLVLALLGTWLFWQVFVRLEPSANPAWALLYLFYPAVVLYSRTLMSDLLSATVLLAAFYLLLRFGERPIGAGLCLGFACLVRYSNVVALPAFVTLIALSPGRRLRRMVYFCVGTAVFGIVSLGYNTYCYGGPLSFPWHLTGTLAPAFLPGNLAFYLPALLFLYPLMLLAPLAAGKYRLALSLPAYTLLLPALFFSYIPSLSAGATGLAIGLRYLLPATPFFTLAYALAAHRLTTTVHGTEPVKYAFLGLIFALSLVIQFVHAQYLETQDRYRRLVLDSVPEAALLVCNARVSEFLSAAWGWRDYIHFTEHNVPVPVDRAISARDTVYAAILETKVSRAGPELVVFGALLARHPGRVLVSQTDRPCWFRVFRLKPVECSPN